MTLFISLIIAYLGTMVLSVSIQLLLHWKLKASDPQLFEKYGTAFSLSPKRAHQNYFWILESQYKDQFSDRTTVLLDFYKYTIYTSLILMTLLIIGIILSVLLWQTDTFPATYLTP